MCWLYISSNVIQKQSDKPLPVVPSLLISWLWFHVTTHYHSISTLSTVYIQTIVGRPPAENWVIISCHNCLLSPQYTIHYAGAGFLFLALHDALAPGLDAALSTVSLLLHGKGNCCMIYRWRNINQISGEISSPCLSPARSESVNWISLGTGHSVTYDSPVSPDIISDIEYQSVSRPGARCLQILLPKYVMCSDLLPFTANISATGTKLEETTNHIGLICSLADRKLFTPQVEFIYHLMTTRPGWLSLNNLVIILAIIISQHLPVWPSPRLMSPPHPLPSDHNQHIYLAYYLYLIVHTFIASPWRKHMPLSPYIMRHEIDFHRKSQELPRHSSQTKL